jgi:hypothetical protein
VETYQVGLAAFRGVLLAKYQNVALTAQQFGLLRLTREQRLAIEGLRIPEPPKAARSPLRTSLPLPGAGAGRVRSSRFL